MGSRFLRPDQSLQPTQLRGAAELYTLGVHIRKCNMTKKWDFFISHASEDKTEVVEPLARELISRGATVWYDQWTLQIGDSLSGKIDEGLASSDYGIVVLSPHFFTKHWPQRELSGLVQREVQGKKVILPVWHQVDHAFITKHSPTLADKMAGSTEIGIQQLAEKLLQAIGKISSSSEPTRILGSPSIIEPAQFKISYKKLKITSDIHWYSLTAFLSLLIPPDQGRLRILFLWPSEIRINRLENIRKGNERRNDGIRYNELMIDWEHRIFPGETVQIVGPGSSHIIEYEFDNNIWDFLGSNPRNLIYFVYFEDHEPINGSLSFKELNFF
jgi:hypothetical protein